MWVKLQPAFEGDEIGSLRGSRGRRLVRAHGGAAQGAEPKEASQVQTSDGCKNHQHRQNSVGKNETKVGRLSFIPPLILLPKEND
jgi:hypothetical protein